MPRQVVGEDLRSVIGYVPEDLKQQLIAIAVRERRSVAQIVRMACEGFVAAQAPEADLPAGCAKCCS